jgi:hypothetical protein
VIATKGRAKECFTLIDYLARQSLLPEATVFIGVEDSDIAGLAQHPEIENIGGIVLKSEQAGSSVQRNVGIDHIARVAGGDPDWFISFFDDDFRPNSEWLASASSVLRENPDLAAITGQVLADGVKGPGISEAEAEQHLKGELDPIPCWAQGSEMRELDSLYGCNMAIKGSVFQNTRFDERLPLYAWQEDRDFSFYAKAHGIVAYHPAPQGVHLGAKSGRTSGLRLGYSQIANIVYLRAKGSMSAGVCFKFVAKSLLSNSIKSLRNDKFIDYRGRLKGNFLALWDGVRGQMKPERILSL